MTGSSEQKHGINLDRTVWEYVAGMPSDNLKSWACSYSGYSEDVGRSVCRLEVPRDRVTVILGFGDRLQINPVDLKTSPVNYQAFVVGLGEAPLLVKHDGFQRCIEIELLPWVANKLFRGASAEFTQGVVALEDIWRSQVNLLVEQLSQMSSWQKRFALVDQFFSERFAESNQTIRSEIQWAWNQLEQYGGCIPIQQLAKMLGWSDRYFAARFREQIGITPKAAARRIRFTRAHRQLTLSDNSLSTIAANCGYSDQSHFTREFHFFSGCSPTIYKKAHFLDLLGTPGEIIQG
ncbi:MAG: helix-turn-helix domain-containing protein [Myxacorys californica WJT36-NPBG1]|jgi:AraC-like DNA-binding protein|nr:helix-turn-helix domain-containing protein [Myxacorys californica WJT36-NPBG1]